MDPRSNPFSPGAGTPPPELAGRDDIILAADVALSRVRSSRPAKSQMLLGLRGVGKTVLLNRIADLARGQGYETILLEAPEGKPLAESLFPPLRGVLYRLSAVDNARHLARRALGVLRGFAGAFKVKVGDVEIGIEGEKGTADSGNLESDLPELLTVVAEAAQAAGRPVGLFIDEIQYLRADDFSALIVSDHKIGQQGHPFILFGAGLPMVAGLAGEAKSYAERLFEFPAVGALTDSAAAAAIREPLRREGVEIQDAALSLLIRRTGGYPYFLQEWGSHTWNASPSTPVKPDDVERATTDALRSLDRSFFRVRFDRLTPRERFYMRAMAELGPGPHRSGDTAAALRQKSTSVAPLRSGLIKKGMVYSPQHGDTAFTVPMFDDFMRRSMPGWTNEGASEE